MRRAVIESLALFHSTRLCGLLSPGAGLAASPRS
jgi:hypothetical protein